MLKREFTLCALLAFPVLAGGLPGSWTGNYPPCDGHAEVLKREGMTLGVRFSTSNRALAGEFVRALNYWATILDMDWHEDDTRGCAIQIVDGHSGLFGPAVAARAQFPGTMSFQGWIAFNPAVPLTASELFLTAVHELGHVMGLPHSTNASSVMYFLMLDGPVFLDGTDLAALAARHKLRLSMAAKTPPPASACDTRSIPADHVARTCTPSLGNDSLTALSRAQRQ